MDDRRVSLGCGTLILIALIVMFFSNQNRSGPSSNPALEIELRNMRTQVAQLREAVDEQTRQIAKLEQEIRANR